MNFCESCGQKLDKLELCPYCNKCFCSGCYATHMNWERQHQDWSLYQTSPMTGVPSHFGSMEVRSYGPVYQTEEARRRYRKSRRR